VECSVQNSRAKKSLTQSTVFGLISATTSHTVERRAVHTTCEFEFLNSVFDSPSTGIITP